jgi:Xaa-Pro aminopeptidase
LRERGLADKKVGIDLYSFAFLPGQRDKLASELPQVEWVDTTDLVAELRVVKTPLEIAYQRQAAAIVDVAMEATLAALRPGISEVEVAGLAAAALGAAGSEYAAIPPMVSSGPRSAMVHGMASRRVIGQGDVVCIELGAAVHRYHAIVMRTAVIGAAPKRVADVYDCTRRGLEAAIDAAKPGAAADEPDDACNAVLAEMDLVRRRCHRIGYSIGVAYPPGWLEPMMLVAGDEHVLTPGMSFSLEPNLTLHDEGFGIKAGETVLCTEDGAERLSAVDLGLFEIR